MTQGAPRLIRLRYQGTCVGCGRSLARGQSAWWNAGARTVTCTDCVDESGRAVPREPLQPESDIYGVAGASLQREYERRRTSREDRVRSKFPRLGGLLLKLAGKRQSTEAFKRGAVGERTVGKRLDALRAEGMVVLHNRRVSGKLGDIDHIVVAPSGIHIIDTKRYKGKVELRTKGPMFRRKRRLYVGRRDQTRLVHKMAAQVLNVDAAVRGLPEAMSTLATPVLCFAYADWDLISGGMQLDGVRIMWPKALVNLLRRPGPLGPDEIKILGDRLVSALPPA